MATGAYEAIHPGVYFVVPFPLRHSIEMAGVLACGTGAAASHRTAAHLYDLLPYPAKCGPVHVTAPGKHARRLKGVHVHRAKLAHWDIRERHGIPVTAPIRTVLDLVDCCTDEELERAIAEAFALRLTTAGALRRGIPPGRRGVRRLRALLDADPKRTRSLPERRLLAALRAAGIEEPLTNHRVGRWEVDLYWPAHHLVIEVDGYAAHSSPFAFERDRRKDAALAERGIQVQRFSAVRVRDEPDAVIAWVRATLSRT